MEMQMDMGSAVAGMAYPLVALSVGVVSIPLLIVAWRVVKAPIRVWVPLVFFLGAILLIQGASELIGPERITALIYILAGIGR
jgi:hypothetical protein